MGRSMNYSKAQQQHPWDARPAQSDENAFADGANADAPPPTAPPAAPAQSSDPFQGMNAE